MNDLDNINSTNDINYLISSMWQHYDYWEGVIKYSSSISSRMKRWMKRDNLSVKTMALILSDRDEVKRHKR